jgi:glycosyltransferase involved in cell wall biosynthesis
MKIGFAAEWLKDAERTWSHTPASLRASLMLEQDCELCDIDCGFRGFPASLLKFFFLRPARDRSSWTSVYHFSAAAAAVTSFKLRSGYHRCKPDVILSLGDYGEISGVPQYFYFDMSVAGLRHLYAVPAFRSFLNVAYTDKILEKRMNRQRSIFRNAAGLFAMSKHAARGVVEAYNVEPERVHVIHPGCNVKIDTGVSHRAPHSKPYILFVGTEFKRKAGDLVIEAYKKFKGSKEVDLLIVGPEERDITLELPAGVYVKGRVPRSELPAYFQNASLFVMPSWYDAFGIAFAEALCYGVPVIARDAFAMPELIRDGVNGYLLPAMSKSAEELAELMRQGIENQKMKRTVMEQRIQNQQYFSWRRAAGDMVRLMRLSGV